MYGGLWLRVLALLADTAIVFLLGTLILAGASLALGVESTMFALGGAVLVSVLYWPLLHAASPQATFGKALLALKVCRYDGSRISFLRALARELAKIVSAAPLALGFIMAAFTPRKQGLHDLLTRTVIMKEGTPKVIGAFAVIIGACALPFFALPALLGESTVTAMTHIIMAEAALAKPPAPAPAKPAPKVQVAKAPAPAPSTPAAQQATPPAPKAPPPASVAEPGAPTVVVGDSTGPMPPAAQPAPAPAPAPALEAKPVVPSTPAVVVPLEAPALVAAAEPSPAAAAPAPAVAAPAPKRSAKRKTKATPTALASAKAKRAAVAAKPKVVEVSHSQESGLKFNDLMTAVLYRDQEALEELLKLGKWPDKPDSHGQTPLMVAVELGDLGSAQALLRAGANANLAVRAAEERGDPEIISLLKQHLR